MIRLRMMRKKKWYNVEDETDIDNPQKILELEEIDKEIDAEVMRQKIRNEKELFRGQLFAENTAANDNISTEAEASVPGLPSAQPSRSPLHSPSHSAQATYNKLEDSVVVGITTTYSKDESSTRR